MKFEEAAIKIFKLSDFWAARTFQIAVKLNVFSLIHFGLETAPQIARKTGTNPRAMELLLNALVGLRLLKIRKVSPVIARRTKSTEAISYKNTPLTENFLVLGKKEYFGYGVKLDDVTFRAFAKLEQALVTGKPVRRPDLFQSHPDEHLNFIMAMHNYSSLTAPFLARRLSTRGARRLLDLGCGPGTYSYHFLRRNPRLRATLFDVPPTILIARGMAAKFNLQKRVRLVAGDYHKVSLPAQNDIVFASNICHMESERFNRQLMKKIHGALKRGGKLWIQDMVLSENKTQPGFGAVFSLVMLLNTAEGRNYTWNEYKGWLEKAGFSKIRRLPFRSPNGSTLIEAIK